MDSPKKIWIFFYTFPNPPENEHSNLQLGRLEEGLPDAGDDGRLEAAARVGGLHLHQHPALLLQKGPIGPLYFYIEKGFQNFIPRQIVIFYI